MLENSVVINDIIKLIKELDHERLGIDSLISRNEEDAHGHQQNETA